MKKTIDCRLCGMKFAVEPLYCGLGGTCDKPGCWIRSDQARLLMAVELGAYADQLSAMQHARDELWVQRHERSKMH